MREKERERETERERERERRRERDKEKDVTTKCELSLCTVCVGEDGCFQFAAYPRKPGAPG